MPVHLVENGEAAIVAQGGGDGPCEHVVGNLLHAGRAREHQQGGKACGRQSNFHGLFSRTAQAADPYVTDIRKGGARPERLNDWISLVKQRVLVMSAPSLRTPGP